MPRMYTVTFEGVAVSAAQDLVTILLPTSAANFKQVSVSRYWVGCTDTSLAAGQMLQLRARWLPATVTAGSGGTTPTPNPLDPGDTAAKCTAHVNDTSKSTTSGTAVILDEQSCHLFNGYDSAQQGRQMLPLSNNSTSQQAFVWELLSTVSGTVHLSGGVDFIEAG